MPETFDPYYKWLGIPPADQPPNHYRLLGIPLFESDRDVIANAADQRMGHIRAFQTGEHSALSQEILDEISAARVCLLNAEKKTQYDAALQRGEAAKKLPKATALETPPLQPPPVETDNELDLESLASSAVTHHPHPRRRKKAPWRAWAIAGAAVVALVVISVFFLVSGHRETEIAGSQQASKSKPEATVETKKPKEESKPEPEPKATAKQDVEPAQPVNQESEPEKTKPEAEKPPVETPEKAEERLKQALAEAKTSEDYRAVAQDSLKAFEQAVAGGQTDLTKKIATIALVAARKAKDDKLAEDAAFCFLSGADSPSVWNKRSRPRKPKEPSHRQRRKRMQTAVPLAPAPLAATPLNERALKWSSQDATYVASSIYDGDWGRHPPLPSLLTDNGPRHFNDQFAFETKTERDPYITITLNRVCTIHSFYIQNRTGRDLERAAGLTMWVSTDGKRWKKVWAAGQWKEEWNEPLDPPARARYVRLGLEGEGRTLHLRTVKLFGYKTGQAPKSTTETPKDRHVSGQRSANPSRGGSQSLAAKVYLDDMQEFGVRLGYGNLGKRGKGPEAGSQCKVKGTVPEHSLCPSPPDDGFSNLSYQLNGRFKTFKSTVGIGSWLPPKTALTFRVFGDGKLLWESRPVKNLDDSQDCNVRIWKVKVLSLQVYCPGPSTWAWAVWVEPHLLR